MNFVEKDVGSEIRIVGDQVPCLRFENNVLPILAYVRVEASACGLASIGRDGQAPNLIGHQVAPKNVGEQVCVAGNQVGCLGGKYNIASVSTNGRVAGVAITGSHGCEVATNLVMNKDIGCTTNDRFVNGESTIGAYIGIFAEKSGVCGGKGYVGRSGG